MSHEPYKLPHGWRWVQLGEVTVEERRFIDPRKYPEETFLLYSIPSYDRGMVPEKVFGNQVGSAKILVRYGLCLFSKLNPRIPRVWSVQLSDTLRQIASTEFLALHPHDEILDLTFLEKVLLSRVFLEQVCSNVSGATGSRQRLKSYTVLTALIPLPPLDEQRRIVARVEALMERVREARALRAKALEETERLMPSALAEVFPRPDEPLPPNWRWVRLGEIANIQSGGTPSRKNPKYWNGTIPWVKISDIPDDGLVSETEETITEEGLANSSAKILPAGTILFSIFATIGKVGVLGLNASTNQAIAGIQIVSSVELLTRFLFYYLKYYGSHLARAGRGMAQNNINQTILKQTPILLPPLEEQRRIVAYLDAVHARVKALKQAQSATEAELQRLEQAILDKAFRGEL